MLKLVNVTGNELVYQQFEEIEHRQDDNWRQKSHINLRLF